MGESKLDGALSRLDRRLREVLDAESRRAARLASGAGEGWRAVEHLTQASATSLRFDEAVGTSPLVDAAPAGGAPAAWANVARALAPPSLALDVLLVLLAPHVEPRYSTIYDVVQDGSAGGFATDRLLYAILGRTPERRAAIAALVATDGWLRGTGLVVPAGAAAPPLRQGLDLDPHTRDALLGLPCPESLDHRDLHALPGWAPDPDTPTLVVHGPGDVDPILDELAPGVARLALPYSGDPARAMHIGLALWRLAALHGAWPMLDLTPLDEVQTARVGAALHRHARRYGAPLVVRTRDSVAWAPLQRHAPVASWRDRRDAWLAEADRRQAPLSADDAGHLAAASRLGPARIGEAFAALVAPTRDALAAQAARIAGVRLPHGTALTPTHSFDDLVLVDTTREALERLLHFVRHRDRLAEQRGLEHRFRLQRGPIALFSGRPGTGKTLAAEVMAHALGRALHVVDLSRLVSKYIGETEKHIDEVLRAGERAGAVLLFDEADSLFAKRTDVSTSNDRFANLEVGYLLQRIEHHDGLVILSTNLRRSVDEAFLRRFHSRIEFPLPPPPERAQLWRLMLPPAVPRREDLDFDALAVAHRLSGGEIRNAALKAIFMAEQEGCPVSQDVLERAIAIELLELGRLSRRPTAPVDTGSVLAQVSSALQDRVERHVAATFLKEVHMVHGAPTKENLAGKRPAASLALYRLVRTRAGALQLGFVASAWCGRAEEEHALLGVLHAGLSGAELDTVDGRTVHCRVAESYDFDLLHRFWSSHGQPVRASVVLDVVIEA